MTDALLDAVAAVTAAIVAITVWYLVRRNVFRRARRSNLIPFVLVCLAVAAILSFLLFNALAYEEAYGMGRGDTGRRYPLSRDPVMYWFVVAFCYCGAVAALSFALAAATRFFAR